MQKIDDNLTFRTSDLLLAAWLVSRGARLYTTDSSNLARIVFVLVPRPIPDDLAAYAEAKAICNVQDFGTAIKQLKRALHQAQDGGVQ